MMAIMRLRYHRAQVRALPLKVLPLEWLRFV
jgi:hypothetical protein